MARKGNEIKFVYGKDRVGLSFSLEDNRCRFALLEQRVTLDHKNLRGQPTGYLNLLFAANAINQRVPSLRCVVSTDRLRFRRAVFLTGRSELEERELKQHIDRLLADWSGLFQDVRQVQQGAAWSESLRIPPPLESEAEGIKAIEELLTGVDVDLVQLDDDRIGIGPTQGQVVLSCHGEQVLAEVVIRPWKPPGNEIDDARRGNHAPALEALLKELNAKNHDAFPVLFWDPRRGVCARALLAEGKPALHRMLAFLDALDVVRVSLRLESIDV